MKILDRSYSGQNFRPRPEIHLEDNGQLLIVATPWGHRSGAKKVIECIRDFYLSARNDEEVTSPFQMLTCLSPAANNLRVAVMLANDQLYREDNKSEYVSGVELFVGSKVEREFVWTQIGYPQVYLKRQGRPLTCLGGSLDMSMNLSGVHAMAPLPQNLLGLATTSNFSVQFFRPQNGDQLLLLSRSRVAPSIFSQNALSLESLADQLVEEDPEMAFWTGLVQI
jgi:hypothetical protein